MKSTILCLAISALSAVANATAVYPGYCSESKLNIGCRDTTIRVCHNGPQLPRCVDNVPACACPTQEAMLETPQDNEAGQLLQQVLFSE